jgi:hypothetical protein
MTADEVRERRRRLIAEARLREEQVRRQWTPAGSAPATASDDKRPLALRVRGSGV